MSQPRSKFSLVAARGKKAAVAMSTVTQEPSQRFGGNTRSPMCSAEDMTTVVMFDGVKSGGTKGERRMSAAARNLQGILGE